MIFYQVFIDLVAVFVLEFHAVYIDYIKLKRFKIWSLVISHWHTIAW